MTQCVRCPDPAIRSLGTEHLCHECSETILQPIRERVIARDPFGGKGRQTGQLRPDYGPTWADLQCDRCGATWTGIIGEHCGWCARSYELLIEAQRSVLLKPDLPDIESALRTWAVRLGRNVLAGIITQREAETALERELARAERLAQ